MTRNQCRQAVTLIIGLLLVLTSSASWATTYYVDATAGADTNSGISPTTAWKSIAKVNGSSFQPGDQILFKAGCVWRETFTVPSSGSAGNPIIIGQYGSGSKPVITGADVMSNFTPVAAAYAKTGITTQPNNVIYTKNGVTTRLTLHHVTSAVGNMEWDWSGGTLYVNVGEDPVNGIVEASQRDTAIFVNGKSYLLFQNIRADMGNNYGSFFVWTNAVPTSNITIQDCEAWYGARQGFFVGNANATYKTTYVTVQRCLAAFNGWSGIDIGTGTNQVILRNNIAHHNTADQTAIYHAGIHVWGNQVDLSMLTITGNESYSNYNNSGNLWGLGNGFHIDEVAPGGTVIVSNNYAHDNHDNGIFVEHSSGVQVYYNILSGNGGYGTLIFRSATGNKVFNNTANQNSVGIGIVGNGASNEMTNNQVKNNISVANTSSQLSAIYGGENDGVRGSGNIYSNNCFGNQTSGFITWGAGQLLSSYTAWETAYGQPTTSVKSDPQFVDLKSFLLKATSPCINAGTDVGLISDYSGANVPKVSGISVGALQSTRINPPSIASAT
jgi:parallel beta-helix repeat protein